MEAVRKTLLRAAGQRLKSADAGVEVRDGLTSFSIMWAIALIFSVTSHYGNLTLANGYQLALLDYAVLACCVALILQPRRLGLLALLAAAMAVQYIYRLPVASNNQTIAFFMNLAIVAIVAVAWLRNSSVEGARDDAYERLRVVARYLLATMYFYGIFHKINTDFLDPNASCAVALYKPLTQIVGLQDNLLGRYGSIASTFIIEAITLTCLFWKRFFAVGLIIGLVFHYVIPISAYSWYMDFSSLVLAFYVLTVPREVSIAFYSRGRDLLQKFPSPSTGGTAILALTLLFLLSTLLASSLRARAEGLAISEMMAWHSAWIVIWAVVGGVVMILLTAAALAALPYAPPRGQRQPAWIYLFPAVLFVSCLSPYLGLKTESSIAMFSNLHTEGGQTNHLVFARSLYLADYQREIATIEDSSSARMRRMADRNLGMVRLELERWMARHADDWVTFSLNGSRHERATATTFPLSDSNVLERRLLIFKPVDVARPRPCTH
jgi:hypothetical protein